METAAVKVGASDSRGVAFGWWWLVPCPHALAKAMRVPGSGLHVILAGRHAITANTAIRIGAAGTSAEMWRPGPSP